jgi:hypothetical protein
MKKILTAMTIGVLCFSMLSILAQRTEASNPSLVGYWNLDEGFGDIAHDSSGNGNDGTLKNGPAWVDGKYGKALSFDGANDYVEVEASSSLDVTSQVTVTAWIYPRAYTDYAGTDPHIVSRSSDSGGAIYILGMSQDGKVWYAVNPSPPAHKSVATLPLNNWTHLAMTYDGTYVRLYINGTLDSSYAQSGLIQTTTNWLAIGCKPTSPWGGTGTYAYFNGTIDEVKIYNKELKVNIDLAPFTGFASITIAGSWFSSNSKVTITWDGTTIPTVPNSVITDLAGDFTAIISVPTQTTPGTHTVNATDESGNWATATFTVINMTGSKGVPGNQGPQGPPGIDGTNGTQGPPGNVQELLLVVAFPTATSILAICIAVVALLRKRNPT